MLNLPELPGMAWNYQDQFVAATQQAVSAGTGQTTYYSYDASGKRTRKVTMGAAAAGGTAAGGTAALVSERLYIGEFEIYRGYDGSGNVTLQRETLHVMDDQRRIATIDNKTIDTSAGDGTILNTYYPRYQYGNHLGSAAYELDGSGGIISYEEYHPFGTSSFQAAGALLDVPMKRYRYTGKERDEESGLYYHGARYYAPWLCRWTTADPIGIGDGVNRYVYCRQNPIKSKDGSGMATTLAEYTGPAIGTFAPAEINDAIKTVYGELTAVPHAATANEAKAIASTIFNRLVKIREARVELSAAKAALSTLDANRNAALTNFNAIANHPSDYKKKLTAAGVAKADLQTRYDADLAKARKDVQDTTRALGKGQTRATEAATALADVQTDTIPASKYLTPITLSDIVAKHSQYAGFDKGKQDFKDFPSMSSGEQAQHQTRYDAAVKSVLDLARNPNTVDPYLSFKGGNLRPHGALPGEVKIGGNYFSRKLK